MKYREHKLHFVYTTLFFLQGTVLISTDTMLLPQKMCKNLLLQKILPDMKKSNAKLILPYHYFRYA